MHPNLNLREYELECMSIHKPDRVCVCVYAAHATRVCMALVSPYLPALGTRVCMTFTWYCRTSLRYCLRYCPCTRACMNMAIGEGPPSGGGAPNTVDVSMHSH